MNSDMLKELINYKNQTKESGEYLVKNGFPKRVFEMEDILNSKEFNFKSARSLCEDIVFNIPNGCKGDCSTNVIPINQKIKLMMDILRPHITRLMEEALQVRLWIQFNIPKIEDGNNFGVGIQEVLGEAVSIEKDASNFLEQMSRYHMSRAKMLTKVIKFPTIMDYHECVKNADEMQDISLRYIVMEMRNHYTILHDMINKNLVDIDLKLSQAVDVRQELDLKLGAAFARLQTLFLQKPKTPVTASEAAPARPSTSARVVTSPYARTLAIQRGLYLISLSGQGSGPGDRIRAVDLDKIQPVSAVGPGAAAAASEREGLSTDIKRTTMRKVNAQRLTLSKGRGRRAQRCRGVACDGCSWRQGVGARYLRRHHRRFPEGIEQQRPDPAARQRHRPGQLVRLRRPLLAPAHRRPQATDQCAAGFAIGVRRNRGLWTKRLCCRGNECRWRWTPGRGRHRRVPAVPDSDGAAQTHEWQCSCHQVPAISRVKMINSTSAVYNSLCVHVCVQIRLIG